MTDITNPFFTLIARGVEDAASNSGYTVIYCNTDESEAEEEKYVNILVQKQVDGVLLVPAYSNSKSIKFLHLNGIPVVLIDRSIPDIQADVVRCNSEEGAYQLTKHLIEFGHHRIVTITGRQEVSTSRDRVAGYRRAMKEADLESLYPGLLWLLYAGERISVHKPGIGTQSTANSHPWRQQLYIDRYTPGAARCRAQGT